MSKKMERVPSRNAPIDWEARASEAALQLEKLKVRLCPLGAMDADFGPKRLRVETIASIPYRLIHKSMLHIVNS
jgi:hypothetical protein